MELVNTAWNTDVQKREGQNFPETPSETELRFSTLELAPSNRIIFGVIEIWLGGLDSTP